MPALVAVKRAERTRPVRIAFFDPFSGASGDMILAALINAGCPLASIETELRRLDLAGYALRAESAVQRGIAGSRVHVDVEGEQPARPWSEIRRLISVSTLDDAVRESALAIFRRLAEAEAAVHGVPLDEVHFHEVGGVDAIVDVCGACIGLALLGVERVFCGPPRLGSGMVRSAHGLLPVPAPATAALLARAEAPTLGPIPGHVDADGELLTPTGAAILTTLATFDRPAFSPTAIGYGFGTRELPWPNALRLWIGETTDAAPFDDRPLVIETNIDDMNPQGYELLVERLFEAGALDVWLTPIVMKKGRPATLVSVLCPAARRETVVDALIMQSTTLGVRMRAVERAVAARRTERVSTRWGDVQVKLRGWRGRVIDVTPEYDDCARLARDAGVPLREVHGEARRLAEVYVGRKLTEAGELR